MRARRADDFATSAQLWCNYDSEPGGFLKRDTQPFQGDVATFRLDILEHPEGVCYATSYVAFGELSGPSEPVFVPEPAPALLMLAGLLLLTLLRRFHR